MKILCYLSGYDGCGYYRIQQIMKYLNKHKDIHAKISTQYSKKDIEWCDTMIIQKQTTI